MDIRVNNYNPQFQAAIFLRDSRIHKFSKQAYRYAYEQTEEAAKAINSMDRSTMVVLSFAEKDGKNYMVARNPKTRVQEFLEIENPNHVEFKDRFAYFEMLNNLANLTRESSKKFWGIVK